ncbi:MAG TPA: PEP-CTERM sorting domain-containing protein [Phycisphaerae bacterium]|nr:PEP-CTERM sorting domain-containing protein [Phycisphaerae bacterium]
MNGPIFETLEGRVLLSVTPFLPGDATQDDLVGIADLATLADHYGGNEASWTDGDFNADALVGIADLVALADHYGAGAGGAAVPEPSACALLAAGMLAALRRRRR